MISALYILIVLSMLHSGVPIQDFAPWNNCLSLQLDTFMMCHNMQKLVKEKDEQQQAVMQRWIGSSPPLTREAGEEQGCTVKTHAYV